MKLYIVKSRSASALGALLGNWQFICLKYENPEVCICKKNKENVVNHGVKIGSKTKKNRYTHISLLQQLSVKQADCHR